MFSYEVRQYKLDKKLIQFLNPTDSVFSSEHGIFINRGSLTKLVLSELVTEISSMSGPKLTSRKPFIVFGRAFCDIGKSIEKVPMPAEMIHIDSHDWVTHFVVSDNMSKSNPPADTRGDIEHPHHVEMMSPESKDQFVDKVETVLKNIEIDEVTKVVIARQLNVSADVEIDIRLLIRELIDSQPNSFVFSVNDFVGASPELLVEKFSRNIRCLPMAGTRKRHARQDDDDADIADLRTNIKDHNEHQVVIDDIIGKLSTLSENVTSSSFPHVVRLPHVAHLATSVTATAPEGTSLQEFVDCLHPTPAVAGMPTTKAIELIKQIEGFDRGNYGAPVGWIDSDGDGQAAIAIRCARVNGNQAQLFAGVGIVQGSDPVSEWDETQAKFGVMRDAMMNITQ